LASSSSSVPSPGWSLEYGGKNVTGAISGMVIEVVYNDVVTAKSGNIELKIADPNKKWQGPWYPVWGDLISLSIGYSTAGGMLACGIFQVDEVELNGPPDVVTVKGIAAWITPDLRTPNTLGWENQTILQIATAIAAKHGFKVVGAPGAISSQYKRITQNHETDLAFLKRIAAENNYDCTLQGKTLMFFLRPQLELQASKLTIHRTQTEKFEFKAKALVIPKAAQVTYQDPATKSLISGTAVSREPTKSGDTLKEIMRVENNAQAKAKAEALLHANNMFFATGNITVPGDVRLKAIIRARRTELMSTIRIPAVSSMVSA
jgi:uncharacterized protein